MLFPIIDSKRWATNYSLKITVVKCQKCDRLMSRDIPFATKGYRGLMTKEHSCGKMFISSIATPIGESLTTIRGVL